MTVTEVIDILNLVKVKDQEVYVRQGLDDPDDNWKSIETVSFGITSNGTEDYVVLDLV